MTSPPTGSAPSALVKLCRIVSIQPDFPGAGGDSSKITPQPAKEPAVPLSGQAEALPVPPAAAVP